jgi:hypothetical protein
MRLLLLSLIPSSSMDALKSMLSPLAVDSANAVHLLLSSISAFINAHIFAMGTFTAAYKSYASSGDPLPLTIAPLDASAVTPKSSSGYASVTNDRSTPLSNLNSNNCVIIMQNNYIAEGGTINILSSRSNGSSEFFACLTYPDSRRLTLQISYNQVKSCDDDYRAYSLTASVSERGRA